MLVNRLPYKFLLIFLVFSLLLILPFSLFTFLDSERMISEMDDVQPLTQEQMAVYSQYTDHIADNLISYSFYIFIITFILSLFFSRKFLVQVKELYRGALSLKEGMYDISLDVTTNDELAEVTKAFNDMTETFRRKTNELLRKDHYINAMLDPLWVVDEDNVVIDVNPAFTGLFGYKREEVVGSSIFDFLDDEGERLMRRKLIEREEGLSSTYEISIISKSEGLIPVLISGSPLIEDGEVVGKVGIITDFRSQLALREAIGEEKEKADAIMDSIMDPLVVIDRDYRIVKANLAARVNAGRDIGGESCHEGLHGHGQKCFMVGEECPVKVVFDTGKSFKVIHEHKGMGGKKVFHEVVAYPVEDRYGEVKYAVETMRDVTDRKRFEDEIDLKNRELVTLNEISKILSRSLRAEDIFNKVLDKVVSLVDMDGGGIFFLDDMGRDLTCRFHRGLSADFMKSIGRVRFGEDLPGKVALTGQGMVTDDVSKDHRADKSMFKHSGIKGFACIPIRGKEKSTGVFFIFSVNLHVFTPEEERILNSISEMMGIAFENIRLYEKMREMYEQNRKRRAEEQRNLLTLSSMLTITLDMKSALASSLSIIKDSCRADLVWLLEAGEDGELAVRSAVGEELAEGVAVCPEGASCMEMFAMDRRKPVVLSDLQSETKFYMSEQLKKYENACSLPMYIGEKSLGALTLYFGTPRLLSEDEVFFLQTVTSVLAVALERARLYEKIILQRGMADTVLESIADGVMTVDTEGRLISVNSAASDIIGVSPLRAVGMNIGEVFGGPEDNAELKLKVEDCLEGALAGRLMSAEAGYVASDERRLPLMFRSAPVRGDRGGIAGVVYVLRDLSREVELDMMKTDFVKSVSHEFRTPLTAIVGMTEMMLDGEVSGERAQEYMGTILSEGNRLSDMVSDVLDIARIESGKEVFREAEIDFGSLVRHVKDTFGPVMEKKEVGFSSDVNGDIVGYRGDEDKLKQLVRILVDNSLTYSDKGCAVELSVGLHDGGVRIILKDEGWGMEAEELRHVGEKFYRGRHAAKTKGTGLGIALARGIVKMHGGEMEVKSKKGMGTTVVVYLPIRRD
jgi:PAS domain S-box-containing protein